MSSESCVWDEIAWTSNLCLFPLHYREVTSDNTVRLEHATLIRIITPQAVI